MIITSLNKSSKMGFIKANYLIQGYLFICLFASCISFELNQRKDDDGSTSISSEEKKFISTFSVSDFGKISSPNQFQWIQSTDIKTIEPAANKLIVIWASWCPACKTYLKRISEKKNSLKKRNIKLVLISQDCNIEKAQEVLALYKLNMMSYLIDPGKYGRNEIQKQEQFLSEIYPQRKKQNGGVPNSILMNKDGKVLVEIGGNDIDLDKLGALIDSQ